LHKGTIEQTGLLQQLADKYSKTPYQIAINWLLSQPNVVTIPKTTQVVHLEENLGALGWQLSNDDMTLLTKDFPNQQYLSERVPLTYEADVPV
jgi:diketogulonate reductase-like aldo/keto reductase